MKKTGLILLLLVFILTSCGVTEPTTTIDETTSESNLNRAEDYAALIELISQAQSGSNYPPFAQLGRQRDMVASEASEAENAAGDKSFDDYARTNIQVEGVDEADIIKTDGRYIYLVANSRLYIIDAENPAAMQITASVKFSYAEDGDMIKGETPIELYLDPENERIALLVTGYISEKVTVTREEMEREESEKIVGATAAGDYDYGEESLPDEPAAEDTPVSADNDNEGEIAPDAGSGSSGSYSGSEAEKVSDAAPDSYSYYMPQKEYVTTLVYDVSDRTQPQLMRRFSQEGYYLTSRRIDSAVYVVSNQYNYQIMAQDAQKTEIDPQDVFPATTDGDVKDDWQTVPADSIAVVPQGDYNNQIVISALDIKDETKDEAVMSLIGSSGTVYASADYLYIAAWQYNQDEQDASSIEVATDLYRFRLDAAGISEAGSGTVPGAIVNQFSMDEHGGYFRIATTSGTMWSRSEADTSKNNVYVLDDKLDIVGQVTGLAPGESIKSVRFLGEMAYVVTFRTVDPLFVIDLSEPTNPLVLGELKIPGYSTYLHPVSDTLLLGFGYDVIEMEDERIVNAGIKVSVFDVSDYSSPQEISSISLGGMGSWSDVLYSHKSLLYSREKNIIAFPASLTAAEGIDYNYELEFQGLVVLSLDEDNVLSRRGGVSHLDADEKDSYGYDAIYHSTWIADTLYTLSAREIRASNLVSLAEQGSVTLPGYDEQPTYYYGYGIREDIETEQAETTISD